MSPSPTPRPTKVEGFRNHFERGVPGTPPALATAHDAHPTRPAALPGRRACSSRLRQRRLPERARAEQPSAAWTSTASENGDAITLVLKPATAEARLSKNQREADQIIAFTEDGWFDTDKPQTLLRHEDGSLTITLLKADAYLGNKPPKTLRVILRNDAGWLQDRKLRCLQIAPRIQRGG